MKPEKQHDSIMNVIDHNLENTLGLKWLSFCDTVQYKAISQGIWDLVHGKLDEEDSE